MQKAKKYDWADSNLAMFGSDTEKSVKKDSATGEPAWAGAGEKESLKIWRIVKFQVKDWPEEDYGKFYSGDSYIILNTYKPDPTGNELAYDVHFWIGSKSSQDEYGTVAYKTVELDTFLDDAAVQHREVEGHESELFGSYFDYMEIMQGGADTGFRHVKPEEYTPRLLHFSGTRKNIAVTEVPRCKDRLKSDDVYILDLGLKIFQWNGTGANKDEKFKAMQYMQKLKSERGKAQAETLRQADIDDSHPFYAALTEDDEEDDAVDEAGIKELWKVSDASGTLEITKIKEGDVTKSDLGTDDVFIVDVGNACYVYVGKGASKAEKQNGMSYAHKHLSKTAHPLVPVMVIKEGQKSTEFDTAMAA